MARELYFDGTNSVEENCVRAAHAYLIWMNMMKGMRAVSGGSDAEKPIEGPQYITGQNLQMIPKRKYHLELRFISFIRFSTFL